jgi:diguanylate cyclase (GGDEF)-like protein/PAS domain S-box-containing protein
VIDASEEMAAAEALRRSEQLLRRLTETVPVGLCLVTPDRSVSYLNPALGALLGTTDVADADALERVLAGDQPGVLGDAITEALVGGRDSEVDVTLQGAGPVPLRCRITLSAVLDQGDVTGALLCVVDVTELTRQATTDPLTGLLNRQAVLDILRDALADGPGQTGVLFLDLDRFKPVNDEHGHRVGDLLLVAVADRLRGAVRDQDFLGRVGGDEFVVLCPWVVRPEELEGVAARIVDVMRSPFRLEMSSVSIGVSVGMTVATRPEELPQEVLDRADAAMYSAKRTAAAAAWA